MTDIKKEYEKLLEELEAVKAHAEGLQKQIEDWENEHKDFKELFISESLSHNLEENAKKIRAAKEELRKSTDSEVSKLSLSEEYCSLLKEQDYLHSAGIQLAVLLNEAGSVKSKVLIDYLLGQDSNERITAYKKKVLALSLKAKNPSAINQMFFCVKHEYKAQRQREDASVFDKYDVGRTVILGNYGNEAVEWMVLDEQGACRLLISKCGLDTLPYNTEGTYVTWERCTLRKWLNGEFINETFDDKIQSAIQTITVDNSLKQCDPSYSIGGGYNTRDKIFLLSYAEAKKYFSTDEARKCVATNYALKNGAYTNDSDKVDGRLAAWWWLRSPGCNLRNACDVYTDGSFLSSNVDFISEVVRPALWLNLDSLP